MTLPHPTIIIPARSGSKRLPGKNLMVLGGKTLLQRCIDTAQEVVRRCGGGKVYAIIDSGYKELSLGGGCHIIRPAELSGDNVSTEDVVRWFVNWNPTPDPLVLMQCTSPFTTVEHVLECITDYETTNPRIPVFSMGHARFGSKFPSGQVYVFSRDRAFHIKHFFTPEHIWREVKVPKESHAIDIDTQSDYDRAAELQKEIDAMPAQPSQKTVTLHCYSTDRADHGHLHPLYKAAANDKRFRAMFSGPGGVGDGISGNEILFLQGDRTELLEVCAQAIRAGCIVAHAAGGERTKGSTDDCTRDAITKLAHLHYPVHARAKERLLALQEEDWRICVAGEIGVDEIVGKEMMTYPELRERWPDQFTMPPGTDCTILALHPVTNNPGETSRMLGRRMLEGFERIYLSHPNKDPGSEVILRMFKHWNYEHPTKYILLPESMGAHAFRSLMKLCGTIIGNSSALITEAPHLGCLPILVGTRQEGRFPSESDGNACRRILDHLYATVTERGDSIRTKA